MWSRGIAPAAAPIGRRHLSGLILASALVTLDGAATTVSLPAIGRELSASMTQLQWVVNAPLLMLMALLLLAGTLADRFGGGRLIRIGLLIHAGASVACSIAPAIDVVVAARLAQGAGGALVLPACLGVLRTAYTNSAERTRMFGVWAAWTGAAGAAGPLLAGALVDLLSWRAVPVPTAAAAVVALTLIGRDLPVALPVRQVRIPGVGAIALMLSLGAAGYAVMQAADGGPTPSRLAPPVALALASGFLLARERDRHVLFPRELVVARNCVPANAATFAFYFGMFGVSFLIVLYVQQVLLYSAVWAAAAVLPISMMLLFAERFGRLTRLCGTRSIIATGAVLAAAGVAWMGYASHPLPFWSGIVPGMTLFGLGISLAVSALTHAAVAAVPEACAGVASGLNHAVVRAAGLAAVALLGSIAAPGVSSIVSADGVRHALIVCALVVGIGGVWAGLRVRDWAAGGLPAGRWSTTAEG